MKNSAIEWTDHTFNPWVGCTKVSPGCAHCYAEALNARFGGGAAPNWGQGSPRRRTTAHNWNEPRRWNAAQRKALDAHEKECASDPAYGMHVMPPRRPRVFCASLADWLDPEVEAGWLSDLLCLIRATEQLDWLLLTKRPELFRSRLQCVAELSDIGGLIAAEWLAGRALRNIWVGATVEDQQRADERIPELLAVPTAVRFLSCEPLLEAVNISSVSADGVSRFFPLRGEAIYEGMNEPGPLAHGGINWVICGGESGGGARPMHPDWARSLRDQCAAAGVPFFFKQWGEWLPGCQYREGDKERLIEKAQHSFASVDSWWVGKKTAGRLLDGVEHSAFPLV